MATMNVSLPDPMKDWVEEQVKTGHYSNTSDYIRDLIRRDQEYRDRSEALIKALIAGEKSGASNRSLDAVWSGVRKRHGMDVYALRVGFHDAVKHAQSNNIKVIL